MDGFGLLIGHLIGDYILQNDWQAANKTNPYPGQPPFAYTIRDDTFIWDKMTDEEKKPIEEWWSAYRKYKTGHLACTIHCALYTVAVAICSFWWMPWWGLAICFAVHWPIDRFRLAGWWMRNVGGQSFFASGPLSPWSIIVVDNTLHLMTLFVIALADGRY